MQTTLDTHSTGAGMDAGDDEGLVHGHGWAASDVEQTVVQAEPQPQAAWREDAGRGRPRRG